MWLSPWWPRTNQVLLLITWLQHTVPQSAITIWRFYSINEETPI
jgi:hypothetical protein